jgi:hypothetical protein
MLNLSLKTIYILLVVLILSTNLVSFTSEAQWYQGNAKVHADSFNFDEQRALAIKRAIANASLLTSSFVSAENVALDCLLISSKTVLKSENRIRRVEIVNESFDNDILSVTVKVDIDAFNDCDFERQLKKSLIVAQLPLLKQTQAASGSLFDLGEQISKRFKQQLLSEPSVAKIELLTQSLISTESLDLESKYLMETARYLANLHASQFILFGYIRDISLFEQVKDNLLIDDVNIRRNFTLNIYLYDALRGRVLLDKSYHQEANWPFEDAYIFDTNGSLFWRSDFGRMMLNTVSSAVIDINDNLECQPSVAQIVSKGRGQVIINNGLQHGVKLGDVFELSKLRLIDAPNGSLLPVLNTDHLRRLHVIQVDSHSATLTSDSVSVIGSSQLLDLVSLVNSS